MRAHEFINEGRSGRGIAGGTMIHAIDPLADTMPKLFGKTKKTPYIDPEFASYKKYPKKLYATARKISPQQRDALEADEEFKILRDKYQKAEEVLKNNPRVGEPGHAVGLYSITEYVLQDMAKRRDFVLDKAGLPSVYDMER